MERPFTGTFKGPTITPVTRRTSVDSGSRGPMPTAIIIDDSPIARGQLRKLAVVAGYTVVAEAGSAEHLNELYEKHRPDLVTLDIVMPGVDGAAAACALLGRHPEATLVMVTSLNTREKLDACRRAGVKYYLLKPLHPENTVEVLRHLATHPTGTTAIPRIPLIDQESHS
ncbi:MAG: response regulator [Proteobacteria bacterium]|nr:response regulator [Pseudomonadota bacterium]